MRHHDILRIVAKFIIPLIMLFALYVQFHGDYGPGGGFQAGVIFASAFVLYGLIYGLDSSRRVVPPRLVRIIAASGVLLYVAVGVATMYWGGAFLEYNVLADDPVDGQHIGILLIELGVGMTVASVMVLFFYCFTDA